MREHLELYARIKGVPEPEVKACVDVKLAEMDLKPFEHKLAGKLSGGNKRKLGVAISLIGDPPIVFLDEPSTGMDPVARRFMWSVISRVATERKQCSIILTTHSMEEVEALCTRIGIMVGGRLRCLGTSQHLKTRYGSGYECEIKLLPPPPSAAAQVVEALRPVLQNADVIKRVQVNDCATALGNAARAGQIREDGSGWAIAAALNKNNGVVPVAEFAAWWSAEQACRVLVDYMRASFSQCVLAERQGATLRFKVNSTGVPLSSYFEKLENARLFHGVASYTLGQASTRTALTHPPTHLTPVNLLGPWASRPAPSQTSLEQVFNGFAAQQGEERGVARGIVNAAGAVAPGDVIPSIAAAPSPSQVLPSVLKV